MWLLHYERAHIRSSRLYQYQVNRPFITKVQYLIIICFAYIVYFSIGMFGMNRLGCKKHRLIQTDSCFYLLLVYAIVTIHDYTVYYSFCLFIFIFSISCFCTSIHYFYYFVSLKQHHSVIYFVLWQIDRRWQFSIIIIEIQLWRNIELLSEYKPTDTFVTRN